MAKEKQLPVGFSDQKPAIQELVVRELVIETEDGVIAVDGQRLSSSDASNLAMWVGTESNAVYVIDSRPDVSTQALVTVIDRLTRAGASNLVFKED